MFKVSEVKRTTICLTCRGPIAPKELQVSFGKYFQHLQCLSTLQPLTLEMFWSSPELSPAGARRLAAFVKGMSSNALGSGSTDRDASDDNASKDPPDDDTGLVLRLRIPANLKYAWLGNEGDRLGVWNEATSGGLHHHHPAAAATRRRAVDAEEEDDTAALHLFSAPLGGPSAGVQDPQSRSMDLSTHHSAFQHGEYHDWSSESSHWNVGAALQSNLSAATPTTASPASSSSSSKPAPGAAFASPGFHLAQGWPSSSSSPTVHSLFNIPPQASLSHHGSHEDSTKSGVSHEPRYDGETGHSQDFSLTPLSSRAPHLSAAESFSIPSRSPPMSKYPLEHSPSSSRITTGQQKATSPTSDSRHENILSSSAQRSDVPMRSATDSTTRSVLPEFDSSTTRGDSKEQGPVGSGSRVRAQNSAVTAASNLGASTSRMMLPEPPIGMAILTPVELITGPAWSISAGCLTIDFEDKSAYSYVSHSSSSRLSSPPPSLPPQSFSRTSSSAISSSTSSNTSSSSSASSLASSVAVAPTSQTSFPASRVSVATEETRQSSRIASRPSSASSFHGQPNSVTSSISSGQSSTNTTPYSPRAQTSPSSPNSIQISKFVSIQPGRTSLTFLFNPPPETTRLMVLSALVESDALNTPLGPTRKQRASLDLPLNCLINIFSFASLAELYAWSQVSHTWAQAMRSAELWKSKCEREIPSAFTRQLLPRIAPALSNDAHRLVYRWQHPPLTVSQAPCIVCGSSAAQRLANVFLCATCKKSDDSAVLTKRQLSLQFHMSSIDVQEYLPSRLQNCNALVKSDVMLAIAKKRRKMVSGQLRRARLSDHHKYHSFFNEFTCRKVVESNEEETKLATNLVRDFKKLLIEEAKLWVQRNYAFRRAWAIACQNEQGVVYTEVPISSPTPANRMSIDLHTPSSIPFSTQSSFSNPSFVPTDPSPMMVDLPESGLAPVPQFVPFRYSPNSFSQMDYSAQPMTHTASQMPPQQHQHHMDQSYAYSAPYQPIQQQYVGQLPSMYPSDSSSYAPGYQGNASESSYSEYQRQEMLGSFHITGNKTSWDQPVKRTEPMQPAPPHSAVHHSVHTASYHPAFRGQPPTYAADRHQNEARILGDSVSGWTQPAPLAMTSPTSSSTPSHHMSQSHYSDTNYC